MPEKYPPHKNPALNWLKRLGIAGFLFFFIKGLIWIGIFVAAANFGCGYLG